MTSPRLKFSVEIIAGQSPASSDIEDLDTGQPFLQGKAEFGLVHPSPRYESSVAAKRCEPGDILISVRAPVGSVNVADQVYGMGRGLAAVRATDIHPGFLRWVLEDAEGFLRAEANGSTFEAITAWNIGEVPHAGLDAVRQAVIAAFLDRESGEIISMVGRLDDLDRLLRDRMREISTRSVFGLAAEHRHSASDAHSPLFGAPESWDRTKFGYDFTESTERNGDDPPGPLLSISEYRGVELKTRTEGQQASLDVSKYRVVRPGQLAANMMWLNHGGLGVSLLTGYISPDYKAFWISERFEPRYVHHLFRSSRYIDYFAAIATGVRTNAQRVTKTVLDATPVPLPPRDEQIRIADELDRATTHVDAMLGKVADLKSLLLERRAALITDIVTGKKEVS